MGYFDFYHEELTDQQIDELHGLMAMHEKAGMRPYDAALQAVRDKLQQARENEAEVRRLVFEAVKGGGKFKGGQLVLQHGRTTDAGGMELHYLRHVTYNSVGDIESETYSDDYGFGVTAKTLPELKKKMFAHGQVNESATKINTDNGYTTVNALLSRIDKAKGQQKKDALYLSAYGTDRKVLIETAILKLSPGFYTLNIEGRAAPSVTSIIEAKYGMHAGLDVDERLIRGLALRYPAKIRANLTLGLQEIEITSSRVMESALSDKIDAGPIVTAGFNQPLLISQGSKAGLDNSTRPLPPEAVKPVLESANPEPWQLKSEVFNQYPRAFQKAFAIKAGIAPETRARTDAQEKLNSKIRATPGGMSTDVAPDVILLDGYRKPPDQQVDKALSPSR